MTKRGRGGGSQRTGVGGRLVAGLTELRDALRSRRPLGRQLTVRTVELPDEPRPYDPEAVRATRARVNASQAVFARLLGVSPDLVRAWEQGKRVPAPLARRLMDEINQAPRRWSELLRDPGAARRLPVKVKRMAARETGGETPERVRDALAVLKRAATRRKDQQLVGALQRFESRHFDRAAAKRRAG
jgi:DNA-binding transcriptional regulator YiaG